MSDDPSQKRSTQRVDVTLKVQLQYPDRDTFVERFSINVSRTGLFVRARDPAPVGSRVKFEYRLKDDSRILRGTGVVRWARTAAQATEPDSPPGMGIEFIDLDPQSEELVTQIVAAKGEGGRAPRRAPVAKAAPVSSTRAQPTVVPQLDDEEEELLSGLVEGAAPKRPKPESTPQPPANDEPELALDSLADALLPDLDVDVELPAAVPEPASAPEPEPAPQAEIAPKPAPAPRSTSAAPVSAAAFVDPDAPHVIFDLAGPSILATLSMPNDGAPPDRFDERKLDLTLGMSNGTLALGGTGVAVPGLFAWADTRASARARVMSQKLGLTLTDDEGRPALDIDGQHLSLVDIAIAAVRHTLRAYSEQTAVAPLFRVIVPASANPVLLDEIRTALAAPSLELIDDLAAIAGDRKRVIVVALSAIEARVGLVTSGATQSRTALVDCGLLDTDAAIVAAVGRALIKEHGIDVDDDLSLRNALVKQVELARRAEDDAFEVSIAGATVALEAEACESALHAIAARIAIAVEALGEAPVVIASDDVAWPALGARIADLLGRDTTRLTPSSWIRLP